MMALSEERHRDTQNSPTLRLLGMVALTVAMVFPATAHAEVCQFTRYSHPADKHYIGSYARLDRKLNSVQLGSPEEWDPTADIERAVVGPKFTTFYWSATKKSKTGRNNKVRYTLRIYSDKTAQASISFESSSASWFAWGNCK